LTTPRRPAKPAPDNTAERDAPPAGRDLGAGGTFRLEPPRLRITSDQDEERHATWYELFFDLVFVAAVSQLGAALARDPSAVVFARFAGLFVVIVWAWILYTLYANRFDTDDLIFRLGKAGGMLAVAAIAVTLPRVMAGRGGGIAFAACYVILRAFLIAFYGRSWYHLRGEARTLAETYVAGYSFTTGLWLVSIFVSSPWRYVLWGVAMVIDLAIPPRAWRTLSAARVVISHLTERFGTFFIIVLGESVVVAVAGVAGFEFTVTSWVIAGIGFLMTLCLWWIYFDLADTSVVGRGALGLIYVYSHFILLAGVVSFGEGTKLAIIHGAQPDLNAGARWALAGGVAAFALSLAIIHLGAEWTSLRDRTFLGRLALTAAAIIVAAVGGGIAPVAFVALVAAALLGQLFLEAVTPRFGASTVVQPADLAARAGATSAQAASGGPAGERAASEGAAPAS
jgi:low temperature requirement protein LtrA